MFVGDTGPPVQGLIAEREALRQSLPQVLFKFDSACAYDIFGDSVVVSRVTSASCTGCVLAVDTLLNIFASDTDRAFTQTLSS